ncbi:MAG: H-type lectin domain-containing protein [Xanthobacteraceae bacterium]
MSGWKWFTSRLSDQQFDADVRVRPRRRRCGDHHATRILVTCVAILAWSAATAADDLPVFQTGVKSFGLNQPDSPDWALQNLPSGGPTIWTSPPIPFARPFGTKPTVSVAIAGIESGANLDTDRFGFSVEPTDVDASGFKITIRRMQGVLYGVTVTWLAYGANKP